jgi:hypothetical protein
MSRIARFAVLVAALMSLFAVMSSAASAVSWDNSGSTTFTATGTGGTLSVGSNNLVCTGATATGAAPASTAGATYSVTGTVTFSPCTIIGQSSTVACNYTLTGTTFASPVTSGQADVTCDAKLTATGTNICHISGQTPGHYTNATASVAGKLTLTASNTLVVSHSNGTTSCSAFGVPTGGTATGSLTHQSFTVTNGSPTTLGPILTRTA